MKLDLLTCVVWFTVAASGFGLGVLWHSWVTARRQQRELERKRAILNQRRIAARPDTTVSRVSKSTLDRTSTMQVVDVTDVTNKRK